MVAGADAGSKLEKAREVGMKVIYEGEVRRLTRLRNEKGEPLEMSRSISSGRFRRFVRSEVNLDRKL